MLLLNLFQLWLLAAVSVGLCIFLIYFHHCQFSYFLTLAICVHVSEYSYCNVCVLSCYLINVDNSLDRKNI